MGQVCDVVARRGYGAGVSAKACCDGPKTKVELQERLEANKSQVGAWLDEAVREKKLKKLTRPVRYEWVGSERQGSIF